MKRQIFFFIATVFLFSCDNSRGVKSSNNKSDTVQSVTQKNITSPLEVIPQSDSSIVYSDSGTISGQQYTARYRSDDYFYVINSVNDTVFGDTELCPGFRFEDFNRDGYKDIVFHYMSNTPSVEDLVLFDKQTKRFRRVADFIRYPAPEKIAGTKYYYSYHRSGCADMNWDSDLFYIDNFKTIRIGNISGRECGDRDEKDGIYISKVKREREVLYKTLSIETLIKYQDYKWGFIKNYWTKNYTSFE